MPLKHPEWIEDQSFKNRCTFFRRELVKLCQHGREASGLSDSEIDSMRTHKIIYLVRMKKMEVAYRLTPRALEALGRTRQPRRCRTQP